MLETLKKIGLKKRQARIYLACLELGKTTITEITRKTGIKRTTVYENINEMVSGGYLRMVVEGKQKRIVALSPKELKGLIKKREELLDQVMPQLMSMSNVENDRPKIWFYQGAENIMKVYEDVLNYPNSEVYGWGTGDILSLVSMKECEKYIEKRIRKKIMLRLIATDDKKSDLFAVKNSQHLREFKMVSAEEYPFKVEINIYANRMFIVSIKDKMGVIIESEGISSAMRMIFRMCWKGIE
ncbi:MAG: hypothetical protein PF549_04940 [Patescibacteria group bacterium]|jgi:sugar-specific transcriptional regulator TrmB|nr:hypothetical protein [Patescibacteria group bacterium]